MDVFSLAAKITLDTDEYDKGLNGAGGKLSSFAKKVGSAIGTVAKVTATGLGAATTAIGFLTKSALDSYASYEQLTGGIETLFKTSANVVMDYANNAYKTAGMSANEYMETATSFAASLIQGLGGDTEKAARYVDMAITDMSDNANKMGTDMTMLQNAVQGFAKQNYTMLDNFKLGYGGTASEMARLINETGVLGDTVKVTAETVNQVPMHKIIEALHVAQTEMGITGTTAEEAANTIEGSVNSAKAAWKNLVTGLGNENANLLQLTSEFIGSVATAADNILPRIEQILFAIGAAIQVVFPKLAREVPARIAEILPAIVKSGAQLLSSLVQGITDNLPALSGAALEIVGILASGIGDALPRLGSAALEIITSLAAQIGEALPALIPQGLNAIYSFVEGLTSSETLGTLANAALGILNGLATGIVNSLHVVAEKGPEIISNLGQSISENLPGIVSKGGEILTSLVQGVSEALPGLGVAAVEICAELINGLWETDWESTGGDILQAIVDGITALFTSLQATSDAIVATIWDKIQNTDWIALGKQFLNNFISGARMILESLGELAGNIVSTLWDRVKNTDWLQLGKDVLNAIINGIKALFEELGNTASNLVDKICDTLENTDWRAEGKNILNKIITGIRDKFANLGNTAKDLVRKVTDTIINTDWLGVGRDIVSGIANGIGSAAGVLISAAQRVASSALTAIKNFFGIASPSKLMAKEVGRWLPPGIGEGMEQALPQLLGNIKNQMQTVMDTANSAMGGFGAPDVASVMAGSISHVSRAAAVAPGYSTGGGVVVNQTIYAAEQSPIELAANTRAAFQRARWAVG